MVPGIFQVYAPSLGVDVVIDERNTPPLNNCISTLPVKLSVQLIIWSSVSSQLSPPFGVVTVIWLLTIVKFEFEKSEIPGSSTLVILTL